MKLEYDVYSLESFIELCIININVFIFADNSTFKKVSDIYLSIGRCMIMKRKMLSIIHLAVAIGSLILTIDKAITIFLEKSET